jgi:hypothetical protein
MIQRKQTVYLLLTTILSGLFLKGKFLVLTDKTGSETIFTFTRIFQKMPGSGNEVINRILPFTAIAILIPLVAFIVIFLYKKRPLQLRLTLLLLILEFLLIVAGAAYALSFVRINSDAITLTVSLLFPFVEIILTFLAYRGIKHDEKLVRSYDRLR